MALILKSFVVTCLSPPSLQRIKLVAHPCFPPHSEVGSAAVNNLWPGANWVGYGLEKYLESDQQKMRRAVLSENGIHSKVNCCHVLIFPLASADQPGGPFLLPTSFCGGKHRGKQSSAGCELGVLYSMEKYLEKDASSVLPENRTHSKVI